MDIPYGAWLPEMDMEDLREFITQCQQTHPYNEFVDSSSSSSFKGFQNFVTRDQAVNAATISRDLDTQDSYKGATISSFAPIGGSSSTSFTVSFGDFSSPTGSIESPKRISSTRRNRRQAREHILAERKRREKLTQRFISLSALLPEIKKMDKATVIEDASKYIKHLQNRVKELEESSITGKNTIQEHSNTSIKKSMIHGGHELEVSSFDETNSLAYNPGIKVRKLGSNVLLRIYCQKNSSLALKALTEMERLRFTVMCNSVLPISGTAVLITIIAQMSEEFTMTAKDLLNCLQLSFPNFR